MKNIYKLLAASLFAYGFSLYISDTTIHAEETEDVPVEGTPYKCPNHSFLQLESFIEGQEISEPTEFMFNIKNEDGSFDEMYSFVVDPEDEESSSYRVFLDYGNYTITQIVNKGRTLDEMEIVYPEDNQQVTIGDSLTKPCICYSVIDRYIPQAIPFKAATPDFIQLEVSLEGYEFDSMDPKEFVFNVQNEDGSFNEYYSVFVDPEEEGPTYTRIFLDYGNYTISQIPMGRAGNNFDTSYPDNNQNIIIRNDSNGNCISYPITIHYTEPKITA
ncbi:MAG: hypothetical protein KBT48_06625 [Firmicutes bacterium]|nr:hypothetical protein [Bacillota bacterium]